MGSINTKSNLLAMLLKIKRNKSLLLGAQGFNSIFVDSSQIY